MKELNIEEKAKAYDEALKVLHKYDGAHIMFTQDLKEEMFPELKESEDERIVKELLTFFRESIHGGHILTNKEYDSWIAWLEKQGEQKSIVEMKSPEESLGIDSDTYNKIVDECIYGEQKLVDKVEPKFKVGDWISNGKRTTQVVALGTGLYVINRENLSEMSLSMKFVEKWYHLWTIQDAKDGDVLVASDYSIFLFKGVVDCACKHYVALAANGIVKFNEGLEHCWENSRAVHPATQKQHDTLMKAIVNAGYKWDADKKELKKVEQKPAKGTKGNEREIPFSEQEPYEGLTDFERTLADICIGWIGQELGWKQYIKDNADVLLKIAIKKFNSVQDAPFEQKPAEWSEEDEAKRNALISLIKEIKNQPLKRLEDWDGYISWLKSLRPQNNITDEELAQAKKDAYNDALNKIEYNSDVPTFDDGWSAAIWYLKKRNTMPQKQWKPSDEQMEAIRLAAEIGTANDSWAMGILRDMYNNLKKLKEE